MLEHPEMLGHGGQRHVERLGKFRHRCLASGKPRQNGAPGRIGERRESRVEEVGSHAGTWRFVGSVSALVSALTTRYGRNRQPGCQGMEGEESRTRLTCVGYSSTS